MATIHMTLKHTKDWFKTRSGVESDCGVCMKVGGVYIIPMAGGSPDQIGLCLEAWPERRTVRLYMEDGRVFILPDPVKKEHIVYESIP